MCNLLYPLMLLFLAGCNPDQGRESIQPQTASVLAATTVLATIPPGAKQSLPPEGKSGTAGSDGALPSPVSAITFHRRGHGVAYVLADGGAMRVVHNGKSGRRYQQVANPVISPDGRRLAFRASVGEKWLVVLDGSEGAQYDEVGDPGFSPDSRHLVYTAKSGGRWQIVVDNAVRSGELSFDGFPFFSGDSGKIASVVSATQTEKVKLVISTLDFSKKWVFENCGTGLVLNRAVDRMAAVKEEGGKKRVIDIDFLNPDQSRTGSSYDAIGWLAYGPDNRTLAYYAERGGGRFLVMNGKEEALPPASLVAEPYIDPAGKSAVAVLAGTDVYLKRFFAPGAIKDHHYDEIFDFVFNRDGGRYAYSARKGANWFVVVNGSEGPVYDKVVTPQFTPDGKYLVYRARKDGKRFVVVANADGRVLRQHQGFEMVFQPVFTEDGKSVGYGVKDGPKLTWLVEKL